MLAKYQCNNINDYTNALKEIIQQIALLGLWRSKFFEHAAFYGGTALRIFYHLNRFSEDLDFSLLKKNLNFKLDHYNTAVIAELKSFGFETDIIPRTRKIDSNIESAMIKANTQLQFLAVSTPLAIVNRIHSQQTIKIKMEIDVDPPIDFNTETQILLNPIPFEVNIYQKSDLFSTKVHALLNRSWGTRIKGRDWYDFVWYIGENTNLRLTHLESRLRKSGQWVNLQSLTAENVRTLIHEKIDNTNFNEAKKDVLPFITDATCLTLWSPLFFHKIVEKMKFLA